MKNIKVLAKKNIKDHLKSNLMVNRMFKNVVFIMILTNLVEALTAFTDGICASRFISDSASAALSVVNPIILFGSIFASILQLGVEIVCSRKLVQGDLEGVKRTYTLTIISSFIYGFIMMIIIYTSGINIVKILGATDPMLAENAKNYLFGLFCLAPFQPIYSIILPLVNLDGAKKTSYASIISVLAINVIGDIIGGIVFKSIFAIGFATILSNAIGVLILCCHLFRKRSSFRFTFKKLSFKNDFKEVIITGLPAGAKILFIFTRTAVINNIIPFIGGTTIFTAFSFQERIASFVESITGGLMISTLTLSNIFYSEEDEDALNKLLKLVFKISFTILLALSVVLILVSDQLAVLYGVGNSLIGDEKIAVINNAVFALRANAISIPFVTLGCCFLSFLQGTKRLKYAYLSTFLQSLFIPLLLTGILCFTNNYEYRFWIAINGCFIIYPLVHMIYAFIRAKKISFKFRDLFFLPKDFGTNKNNSLKFQIFDISDALEVGDKIISFCKKLNIDNRRTYHIAGCASELAMMTVLSGFTKDRKFHVCEMRLIYKDNLLKLRVRDDCKEFNIKEKAEHIKKTNEHDFYNFSIRIVVGLSKNIEYVNLLKTNNLILTL